MHKTPAVAGKTRPVRRFVLLGACLLLVVASSVFFWPRLRMTRRMDAARRALSEGDAARALELLEDADTSAVDRAELHYLSAAANRRARRMDQFEWHLRRATTLGWSKEDIQRQEWLAVAQSGNVQAVERQLMDTINNGASNEAAEEIYEAVAVGHLSSYRLREAWKCLDYWLHWHPDAPMAHLLRAGIYAQVSDFSAAADDYRAVLEQIPDHRLARSKLGETLLVARGSVEEAWEHFRSSLEDVPDDIDAMLGLAQCERRLGEVAEARRHVDAAMARELTAKQRATALRELGQILLEEGKANEAIEALAEAIELAPADLSAQYTMVRASTAAQQPQKAKRHADRVRQIKDGNKRLDKITQSLLDRPHDAELRFEAGSIQLELGRQDEGIGWLLSALENDPTHEKSYELLADHCRQTGNQRLNAQLHLRRGRGLLASGRLWEALDEFGRAKDHPDTAAAAYAFSGEALYKVGQFGDAVHILDRALQLDPSQTDARRWLAATYHDIGAMDHAMEQLQVVAQQAPADPRPHRLMGLIRKDFEAYDEAIAAYRESLRRDSNQPDEDKIRIELAECQIKLRKHAEALETLGECSESAHRFALEAECHYAQRDASSARKAASQALDLQPDHLDALRIQAAIDLDAGDAESSVRLLRKAVEHHPREFRVRYRLAQAYQRLGERELAEEQMRQMQELRDLRRRFTDLHAEAIKDPADVEIRYQLGVLADQLGKPELARTWYAAVIGMDPEHKDARKALSSER